MFLSGVSVITHGVITCDWTFWLLSTTLWQRSGVVLSRGRERAFSIVIMGTRSCWNWMYECFFPCVRSVGRHNGTKTCRNTSTSGQTGFGICGVKSYREQEIKKKKKSNKYWQTRWRNPVSPHTVRSPTQRLETQRVHLGSLFTPRDWSSSWLCGQTGFQDAL